MESLWGDPRLPGRFWSRVQAIDTGCWLWTGALVSSKYGSISWQGSAIAVHRLAYSALVGPIPDGLQIDHRCHNQSDCEGGRECLHRRCVNPAHLELATQSENQLRSRHTWSGASRVRTRCNRGHEYTPENTIMTKSGRTCRTCHYERVRAYEQTDQGREVRRAAKKRYNDKHRVGPRTHCKRGHELTEENLYLCKGERICKTCHKERAKKYLANNPEAVARQREATRRWRARQKQLRAQSD